MKATCRIQRTFTLRSIGISLLGAFAFAATGVTRAPAAMAQQDTSRIAADGTAYVTRVVPVPATISPEAQKWLAQPASDAAGAPHTVEQDRVGTDRWQTGAGEVSQRLYPAHVTSLTIGGVPVRVVRPPSLSAEKQSYVLLNLHGGGFRVDSGSLTESIPMANLTGMEVVSVLYRMAPEHPFPAALDDAVTVYKELLKTHRASHIAIYGTSAGAILTGEVLVRLKQLRLPMPGAAGIFSGSGDMSEAGDSISMYTLNGLSGHLEPPVKDAGLLNEYAGRTNLKDPVLSPIYADLSGLPPTLFLTSGRDLLLSGTTILHRAYLRAGVDAELIVFEALPHAFWNSPELPESKEADADMAKFFLKHLEK